MCRELSKLLYHVKCLSCGCSVAISMLRFCEVSAEDESKTVDGLAVNSAYERGIGMYY